MATSLYRYFDADDRLLYVGISHQPFVREVQHEYSEKDMAQVRHIELEWFEDRDLAIAAERIAIQRERPLWNIADARKKRKLRETPKRALKKARKKKPKVTPPASPPAIYPVPPPNVVYLGSPQEYGPQLPPKQGPGLPWKRFVLGDAPVSAREVHHKFPASEEARLLKICRADDVIFLGPEAVYEELLDRLRRRKIYYVLPETAESWDRTDFNKIDRDKPKMVAK